MLLHTKVKWSNESVNFGAVTRRNMGHDPIDPYIHMTRAVYNKINLLALV